MIEKFPKISNFKKCNRKDPKWKDCVKEAIDDALPQLTKSFDEVNLPNFEPLWIPQVIIAGGGSVAVTQNYKNCKIFGLTKMKLNKAGFDFDNKTFEFAGTVPEYILTGEYTLDGKVLLLPVKGEGDSTATMKNVELNCLMQYEEVKKKGKKYMKFVSGKGTFKPSSIVFHFDNLFNGDMLLGDEINRVVNENWKLLFEDIEDTFLDAMTKILINILNHFFTASFKKCNRKDPKWKECFKEAAADALPQLSKSFDEVNLPSLEPLWIPQLTIVGGGSVAVTQNYKNCKIFGLSKIKLDKAEVVNENWKLLYEDIEETFTDATMKIIMNLCNNVFAKVSIEEAFD
ncbi:hypothetical protein GEV33_013075 [Tenebrio molitor]|uniref:JHBP domain-containing protein n=1 Tax=Tenebrio molitor TaxID=7067 RepID=A0A8J6H7L6_TENMO|nr:hypothetical protein GEV33_013075 [Tenebrio molitor]